jgi:3-phenylpropionate/trans-cinnamate dioxygenase ferredoxin subunit
MAASGEQLVPVGRPEEIPAGTGKVVRIGHLAVAVFNVGGQFFAIDDRCPHQGSSLGAGALDGRIVTCPAHHFRVDVTTGRNPKIPTLRVASFPIVLQEGVVHVVVKG